MLLRKCRTLRGGRVTVYPPSTHDYLIEQSFPRLEPRYLAAIKRGSRDVDAKYGIVPITLLEENAPQHAMTPYTKVLELEKAGKGMPREQAIERAREWARGEASRFVDAHGERAKALMRRAEGMKNVVRRRGLISNAYNAFGHGAHTLMDDVSPAHHDFQIYSTPWDERETYIHPALDRLNPGKAVTFGVDMVRHKLDENHDPSPSELRRVVAALHNFYRNVFGLKALDEVK